MPVKEKIYKRTIKGIYNESMLNDVLHTADKAKCEYTVEDWSTKVIVSGTRDKMEKWIKLYNAL